jgi:hypothetical protein
MALARCPEEIASTIPARSSPPTAKDDLGGS